MFGFFLFSGCTLFFTFFDFDSFSGSSYMAQVEQNSPNYYKNDEKVKKEEKKIFEIFFAKIVRVPPLCQNFDKKKCPKVLENVVPARNSMSSIDWYKNFHDSKQHDDFYKIRTDGRTNFCELLFLDWIFFQSKNNLNLYISVAFGFLEPYLCSKQQISLIVTRKGICTIFNG